ncbi:MAG: hypothetical protein ACKPEO_09930 [Sphaerospermopsis kisseleviana]
MPRKFLIDEWDRFSDDEKIKLRQLINLSLEAQEIRFSLMDDGDNVVDKEFEVTSNQDDPEAIPIISAIPRVGRFLEALQLFGSSSAEQRRCEEGCDRQYSDNEQRRDKCRRDCRRRRFAFVENVLNSNPIIEV